MIVRRRTLTVAVTAAAAMIALAGCAPELATAELGSCLDASVLQSNGQELPTVDCSTPHTAQVVGVFDLDDGEYPGDEEVDAAAQQGCREAFADFVGVDYDSSSLQMSYLHPSQSTWEQANDREVLCFATATEPVTQSWQGAAL